MDIKSHEEMDLSFNDSWKSVRNMMRDNISKAITSEDKGTYVAVLNQLDLKEPKLTMEEAVLYIEEHFTAYAEALVNVKAEALYATIEEDLRCYFFDRIDPDNAPTLNYNEAERDRIRKFMKENVRDDECHPIN